MYTRLLLLLLLPTPVITTITTTTTAATHTITTTDTTYSRRVAQMIQCYDDRSIVPRSPDESSRHTHTHTLI